jgi:metallo-beta-lactamase class B
LINTDFEETVPVIKTSVEKLGFKFTDIKIILGSHAHPDHMSGDAMVKEMTGARVMAMAEDVHSRFRTVASRTTLWWWAASA